jgi:hypothetical protein
LLIFSPPTSSQPWAWTVRGRGRPAASRIAGQVTAWKRSHEVVVGRPDPLELLHVGVPAGSGQVVLERVDPDVHDVPWVPGDGHPPGEAGPRDGEVLEPLLDEGDDLAPAGLGADELRVVAVVLQQPVGVLGDAEEVVLLPDGVDRSAVDRAVAVDQLLGAVELLAGHTVQALVAVQVDVALVVQLLPQVLHGQHVALLGGADEVVVGDVQLGPGGLPPLHDLVGPGLRVEPAGLGRPGHLLAVLVGPGEEQHPVPVGTTPTRQHVGRDGGVGVADVRQVVDVVDRGGELEGVLLGHRTTCLSGGGRRSRSG